MQQGVRLPWMKQELIEPVRGLGAPGSCRPPTTPSVPVSPIRAKFKHQAARKKALDGNRLPRSSSA
jgi:hypothetical protein